MTADAYGRIDRIRRARRREGASTLAGLGQAAFVLAVLVALVPLVRTLFLWFLDQPQGTRDAGLSGAWLRASLVVMAAVGLEVHGVVLRGRGREVLAIWPVDPVRVVRVQLGGVARRGTLWTAMAGLLTAPVAVEMGPLPWAAGVLVVASVMAMSVTWSALMLLGAVHVAESEAWAGFLDLLRGNNPRAQAAIIWALAPSTAVVGVAAALAAGGAVAGVGGDIAGWGWVLMPALAGLAVLPLVDRLAEARWFDAHLVLGEIRARYATLESPEEALRVFMDWTVSWLPPAWGRWALLELRAGWRGWRGAVSVTWLVAVVAFGVGWTDDAAAPGRVGLVTASAAAWCGGVVHRIASAEPPFLTVWLSPGDGARAAGRAWAVLVWSQAAILTGGLSSLLRQGLDGLGTVLVVGEPLAIVLGAWAAATVRRDGRGLPAYIAGAALLLAGVGYGIGGGT